MISDVELERSQHAVGVAYSVPIIDDVEDYVWESIWSYVKDLPELDGLTRKKLLFDVVDSQRKIGWSAKTLTLNNGILDPGREFEFVIQRANVINKREQLGFPNLSLEDDPQIIGDAVMEHWRQKIHADATIQGVENFRISILLKNKARCSFSVLDEKLDVPENSDIIWTWSNDNRLGVQGRSKKENMIKYKWYHGQTQLFERMRIPETARRFSVEWE